MASDGPPHPTVGRFSCHAPMSRPLGLFGVVTHAATGLVGVLGAEDYQVVRLDDPLRVEGRAATAVTDGEHLRHVLGPVTESGDGLERASQVVGVETGDDHLPACRRQVVHDVDQAIVEELALVDADDACRIVDRAEQLQ